MCVTAADGVDEATLRAMDLTLFPCGGEGGSGGGGADDGGALAAAQTLAKAAQARKEFTDTGSFSLRCLVCQRGLKGQAEAVAHATETGHQNFSQY
jgi:hypothetical protein